MGHMPLHLVTTDLASGTLVGIRVQDVPRAAPTPMSADSRTDALPGPAGRSVQIRSQHVGREWPALFTYQAHAASNRSPVRNCRICG